MQVRCHVRLSGPLTAYAEGCADDLIDRGYAPSSVITQVRFLVDVSRWLEGRRLGLDALSTERVEVFLAQRRRSGRRCTRGVGCGLCWDTWAGWA